jgi:hypothetical protein
MKDFALLFRQSEPINSKISESEMQSFRKKWEDWAGGIAAQGKFKGSSIRLAPAGKVLKAGGVVTDGPFVEIREILGGIMVVQADDIEEATTLAHGCPALERVGCVEIRPFYE